MNTKIMVAEIVEVLAKITEMKNKHISEEEVAETIQKDSRYNKNTVAAAYSWLHEKYNQNYNLGLQINKFESKGLRILSYEEKQQIGLKNYNYLLHFYNVGLLTNNDFEEIIEELKLFPEDTIETENINLLILSMFLDLDKISLPGSRHLLYSTDNIN